MLNPTDVSGPPALPNNETEVEGDTDFFSMCSAEVDRFLSSIDAENVSSKYYISQEYGQVMRTRFILKVDPKRSDKNVMICSSSSTGEPQVHVKFIL